MVEQVTRMTKNLTTSEFEEAYYTKIVHPILAKRKLVPEQLKFLS